jgi:hypothetical protein
MFVTDRNDHEKSLRKDNMGLGVGEGQSGTWAFSGLDLPGRTGILNCMEPQGRESGMRVLMGKNTK